jgi:hypothetical protein
MARINPPASEDAAAAPVSHTVSGAMGSAIVNKTIAVRCLSRGTE